MEDNTKYIENYKSMLSNTSLIQNSNKPISKTNNIKLSFQFYNSLKHQYPDITQYDIDKIFFDNNLPLNSKHWTDIDRQLFIKAVKKKTHQVDIVQTKNKKELDVLENHVKFVPISNTTDTKTLFHTVSISSEHRDKSMYPNSYDYRILFTRSGSQYNQSYYLNKILIDISCVELKQVILPKTEALDNSPFIYIKIKELGSNIMGEDYFAKLFFTRSNDNFMEFSSMDREIYRKEYKPGIIIDTLNISFHLSNGDYLILPDIENSITFSICCTLQSL